MESEVTKEGILKQQGKIDKILESIRQYEAIIWPKNAEETKAAEEHTFEAASLQQLISLYNKAIEFYSAVNDERHIEFL